MIRFVVVLIEKHHVDRQDADGIVRPHAGREGIEISIDHKAQGLRVGLTQLVAPAKIVDPQNMIVPGVANRLDDFALKLRVDDVPHPVAVGERSADRPLDEPVDLLLGIVVFGAERELQWQPQQTAVMPRTRRARSHRVDHREQLLKRVLHRRLALGPQRRQRHELARKRAAGMDAQAAQRLVGFVLAEEAVERKQRVLEQDRPGTRRQRVSLCGGCARRDPLARSRNGERPRELGMIEPDRRVDVEALIRVGLQERRGGAETRDQRRQRLLRIGPRHIERRNEQGFDPLGGGANVHEHRVQRRRAGGSRDWRRGADSDVDSIAARSSATGSRLRDRDEHAESGDTLVARDKLGAKQRPSAKDAAAAHGHRQTKERRQTIVPGAVFDSRGEPERGTDEEGARAAIDHRAARAQKGLDRSRKNARDRIREILGNPQPADDDRVWFELGTTAPVETKSDAGVTMPAGRLAQRARQPAQPGRKCVLRQRGSGDRHHDRAQQHQSAHASRCRAC